MGLYNRLKTILRCGNCQSEFPAHLQFKFGNLWLIEYKIGDTISWGKPQSGISGLPRVKVYGILEKENCPHCSIPFEVEEFDILVENDVIVSFEPLSDYHYWLNDGDYREI